MNPPRTLCVPCLTSDDEDHIVHEAGAFLDKAEAQKVFDVWRRDGRVEPAAFNIIKLYDTAADWQKDR